MVGASRTSGCLSDLMELLTLIVIVMPSPSRMRALRGSRFMGGSRVSGIRA